MKITKMLISILGLLLFCILFLNACGPIRNFIKRPQPWQGKADLKPVQPAYDVSKKTVFIMADYKLTELFDMLAPFYLFNETKQANVFIVAKDKTPILIKKGLFVLPQLTFHEADSMKLSADVIVIPALSARDENQDTILISWIRKHYNANTKMLAICDGASTAAATGLYDGKLLTCHASDFAGIKSHFEKPVWVQNVSVTKDGNLFSTAGVSNAVDGSLVVIDELFGRETMQTVLSKINYPRTEIKTTHKSIALNGSNKMTVVKKVFFRKNRNIGLLLENEMNEFEMAGIIDIYGRTFPASFKTHMLNDSTVKTMHGLTLIQTGSNMVKGLDELHVVKGETFSKARESLFKNAQIIRYNSDQKQYLVNTCLERIGAQYGQRFKDFVKISLDYN